MQCAYLKMSVEDFTPLGTDLQIQVSGFKFSLTEISEFLSEPKMVYLIAEC